MIIGLYSTRLIYNALGETNFGIFTVIGSTIGLLTILNTALNSTTMRFIGYSIGSQKNDLIGETFQSAITTHLIIGIFLILVLEIAGYQIFNNLINIPTDKIDDSRYLFHFVVLITFFTVIFVPFEAIISANEDFVFLSILDIISALLRLIIAATLFIVQSNWILSYYGLFLLIIQIISLLAAIIYIKLKYKQYQTKFRFEGNWIIIKEMLSYGKWSLLSSITGMGLNQGKDIIFNMFFGVGLNASNGIANTIGSNVNNFASSLSKAFNPALFKSEGAGNRNRLLELMETSSKFSIYLYILIAIPIYFKADYLVLLWLKSIPQFSVILIRLFIIMMFIEKLTFEITTAIRAVGNIKGIIIFESIVKILPIPISYFLFLNGFQPQYFLISMIFASVIITFSRLFFAKKILSINIMHYVKTVILRPTIICLSSYFSMFVVFKNTSDSLLIIFGEFFFTATILSLLIILLGLTKKEKQIFSSTYKKIYDKCRTLFNISKFPSNY
jgi:O-antigen/teichoic acid export membrane protein